MEQVRCTKVSPIALKITKTYVQNNESSFVSPASPSISSRVPASRAGRLKPAFPAEPG